MLVGLCVNLGKQRLGESPSRLCAVYLLAGADLRPPLPRAPPRRHVEHGFRRHSLPHVLKRMLPHQEQGSPFFVYDKPYPTRLCGSGTGEWLAWVVLAEVLRRSAVGTAVVRGLQSAGSWVRAAGGPSGAGRVLGACRGAQTCLLRRKRWLPSSENHRICALASDCFCCFHRKVPLSQRRPQILIPVQPSLRVWGLVV